MICLKKSMLGAAIALFAMNTQAANVETELSAAHGYVETLDGKVGATGISIPGEDRDANGHPMNNRSLTSWTNANACAVYYFHHAISKIGRAHV